MAKNIMAIGGHIGDMELTAGGVLATAAAEGGKIVTVALTAGERGNPPHLTVPKYRKQKEAEAAAFAEALGGEAVVFPYVDGELPENDEVAFALCDLIRKHKPDILITHWQNSMHKDHAATHNIVKKAQFYAGLKSIERELPAHYADGPFYAENWEDAADFVPYVYAEVSPEGFALWEKAINTQWFALNSTSFKYKDYYAHLMRVRGIYARREYAEAFEIDKYKKYTVRKF